MATGPAERVRPKWTNIPTKYAIGIVLFVIIIIVGSAWYGPHRWRAIAKTINASLRGKPEFANVVAVSCGGVRIYGKVQKASDIAELERIVEASHSLPVYVDILVTIEADASPPRAPSTDNQR